ncbi:hypothetical protein ACHQM5_007993 [Ranunculus cassubicifolius]
MKLFQKRHYTSLLPSIPNPNPQSEILDLCKLGSLQQAIKLLNTTSPHEISIKPVIYASLLQTCIKAYSFTHGLQLHSHVIKSGLVNDRFVGNSLLSMYFKLSSNFADTHELFDKMSERDVISWTSMITWYVKGGKAKEGIDMFWRMLESGVEPNAFTLSSVIKACSELGALRIGVCFHGVVLRKGFEGNHVIASSLMDMYGRNFCSEDAWTLFDDMSDPDAICWTSVISAFTRNDRYEEALGLFYLMIIKHRLVPDGCTFGTVLTACGNLGRDKQGKQLHGKVVTSGICGDLVVESSLVDMYGKCGLVEDSRGVFDRMQKKNEVSWCALLAAYCQNRDYKTVLEVFRGMKIEDHMYSFGTVIRACAGLADIRHGKEVHCRYLRKGGRRNVIVESALVDLYAKCGCIHYAQIIFLGSSVRNIITWNSMICGLAQNGRAKETLGMFDEMVNGWFQPDSITFIGVLFACSHAGLVDEGRKYFRQMHEDYNINAGIEHYNCMVDLLGRAGFIEEAEDMLENSGFRDDYSLWTTLLGACTSYSNLEVAERIAKKMMELQPEHHLSYILLANLYGTFGRWDDAQRLRKLMEEKGIKKMLGKSWIDIKDIGLSLDVDIGGLVLKNKLSAVGE